jgi:hypothetical protein
MSDNACRDCDYWKREESEVGGDTDPDDVKGECRRHPPALKGMPRWPITAPNEWCGEFKKARKSASKKPRAKNE